MVDIITVYTIGFTQHSAQQFFTTLKQNNIRRLIDIRLNNVSQLAGFAKKADLQYFLKEIVGAEYAHMPQLAPTQDMLDHYKKQKGNWQEYQQSYLALIKARAIENTLSRELFEIPTVLLCSEHTAEHCHRRLVLEYLNQHWHNIQAVHL
jgi:uncharacterized protein (DUF488 family)